MFTIRCHGNLALNLQLVLIVSRAPCFGVELLKVAELPILESLCCPPPSSGAQSGAHSWCTLWCTQLVCTLVRSFVHTLVQSLVHTVDAHSDVHSWCIVEVEVGAAFRPSQARPKSTPSVFLILNPAPAPTLNIRGCTHSQWPPHVSLNPALRPPSRTFQPQVCSRLT